MIKEKCWVTAVRTCLSVQATVVVVILDAYVGKALANCSCGLVGSQNTLSRCHDRIGDLGQFLLQSG